jgi:stage V sporulation protein D (sporulation-specific penicillin-binding protein)
MITAVSAIANNGVLVQPKIVKSMTNVDTGEVTTFDTTEVRQVISSETAAEVCSMMKSVATEGTGKKANIVGYSIGGKTGTSEPMSGSDDGYVSSYIAISPVEDTKIVLLVILYGTPENNHNSGTIVAPVVKKMLSEILPYMGIPSDGTEDTTTTDTSTNEQLY